jgi:hypothetical protein
MMTHAVKNAVAAAPLLLPTAAARHVSAARPRVVHRIPLSQRPPTSEQIQNDTESGHSIDVREIYLA